MFNPALGFKLSTYAFFWIKQHVSRAIYDEGFRSVRIPCYLNDKVNSLRKYLNGNELPKNTDEATTRAYQILSNPLPTYLDAAANKEEGKQAVTMRDFLIFHEQNTLYEHLEDSDIHMMVILACKELDPRKRAILEMRYGLDGEEEYTLDECAKEFGITKERVRQIEVEAMSELKDLFGGSARIQKEVKELLSGKAIMQMKQPSLRAE